MEKISLKNLGKNTGKAMKVAAAFVVAAAFLVSSSMTPAPDTAKQVTPDLLNPAPVVMVVEEAPEAIVEEETVEEKTSKKGFFFKVKMAIYAIFAACTAWVAHKIPWKKIFNKRNFYILLSLVFIGLSVYAAWPFITD